MFVCHIGVLYIVNAKSCVQNKFSIKNGSFSWNIYYFPIGLYIKPVPYSPMSSVSSKFKISIIFCALTQRF